MLGLALHHLPPVSAPVPPTNPTKESRMSETPLLDTIVGINAVSRPPT